MIPLSDRLSSRSHLLAMFFIIVFASPVLRCQWNDTSATCTPICVAAGDQVQPSVSGDGAGGAYVAWTDFRDGSTSSIYAQHLSRGGYPLWGNDGIRICTQTGEQSHPSLVSDSQGGIIAVWNDNRASAPGVYAQRLNASGNVIWTPDGIRIGIGEGLLPTVMSDGAGGVIIGWMSDTFRLQRIDRDGQLVWGSLGVGLPAKFALAELASDCRAGVIAAYNTDTSIVLQRVDSLGEVMWDGDGVVQPVFPRAQEVAVSGDGTGGAMCFWNTADSVLTVKVCRVDAGGKFAWETTYAIVDSLVLAGGGGSWALISFSDLGVLWDGGIGAIVSYCQYSRTPFVKTCRVDTNGVVSWTWVWGPWATSPIPVSTVDGRVFMSYWGFSGTAVAQFDQEGVLIWPSGSDVRYVTLELGNYGIAMDYDGEGGVVAAWSAMDGADYDVVGNRLLGSEGTLPVEMTSFSASVQNETITLRWRTESELSNYGFEIQRRVVGGTKNQNWLTIGFKSGNGTSSLPHEYRFVDCTPVSGRCAYRLMQINHDGSFSYSHEIEIDLTPTNLGLLQNYPNPFNPSTTIRFGLPFRARIQLTVFNTLGQRVATLVDGELNAGYHEVSFDATRLASGVYLYRLQTGEYGEMKKLILIR